MTDDHAKYPPSSLDALSQCPYYLGGGATSEAAERGTAQHKALEQAIRGAANWPDALSPLEIETVQFALDWFNAQSDLANIQTEVKLEIRNADFDILTYGTADAIIPEPLTVVDFKTGEKHPYLLQVFAYALGAMQRAGAEQCKVVLLFGRLKITEQYTVSEEEAMAAIEAVFAGINAPDARPRPCDFCGWCNNRETCPATKALGNALVFGRDDWRDVSDWLPSTWHPSKITRPEDMKKMLEIHAILRTRFDEWSESVKFHAREMIDKGIEVPGWEVAERKMRQVADLAGLYGASGLDSGQFLKCCEVKFTELEAAYAAMSDTLSKAAAKRELDRKIEPFLASPKISRFVQKAKK